MGLTELWGTVLKHRGVLTEAGESDVRRDKQRVRRTWSRVRDTVPDPVLTSPGRCGIRADIERQVRDGEPPPALAAQQILDADDQRSRVDC